MIYFIAFLVMASVALLVFSATGLAPAGEWDVRRRLKEIDEERDRRLSRRRQGRKSRKQIEALAAALGEKIVPDHEEMAEKRLLLTRAGFRGPTAVTLYYGVRLAVVSGLIILALFLARLVGMGPGGTMIVAGVWGMMGWLLPRYVLAFRIRKRRREVQLALPDMLDMLVVCVEAGLGLNQAMARVSEEIESLSPILGDELQILNLEMQAGTPRSDALKNLADRVDSDDVRSLVAMLVQTDRFGTSIARALRVHSRSLRTKRRQRAEEAAAKTTIKLVFPLVLFIFPALFVVILAPAILHIIRQMGSLT